MESRGLGLLGGSLLLLAVGVVGSLVYFGDATALMLSIILTVVGALGMNIAWVLRGVVQRVVRLERDRERADSSASARTAEQGASADRLRD
jgi:hypothetical protein